MSKENYSAFAEIYDNEFIEKFGEHKQSFSEFELSEDSLSIDVYGLIQHLGIELEEQEDYEESGCYLENKIILKSNEPEVRKRFTAAHELGHCILKHDGSNLRTQELGKYQHFMDSFNESEANNFAAELLMPIRLLQSAVAQALEEMKITSSVLTDDELVKFIDILAKKMSVSKDSIKYRLINTKILKVS